MNIKKAIALFLAMATALAVFTIPASAVSDDNSDSGIAPHYELCPDCGGSIVNLGTTWENKWTPTIETKCTHYPYGTDITLEDSGTQKWRCSSCKRTTTTLVTRTKSECHGFNMRTSVTDVESVASADNGDAGIAPHYELCPDCGGSIVNLGTTWDNDWTPTIETKCTHYPYGTDITFEDSGTQKWRCSSCKRTTTTLVTRTKSECHGFNLRTSATDLEEVECTHYCYGTDLIAKDGTKDCHGFDMK